MKQLRTGQVYIDQFAAEPDRIGPENRFCCVDERRHCVGLAQRGGRGGSTYLELRGRHRIGLADASSMRVGHGPANVFEQPQPGEKVGIALADENIDRLPV